MKVIKPSLPLKLVIETEDEFAALIVAIRDKAYEIQRQREQGVSVRNRVALQENILSEMANMLEGRSHES